MNDVLLSEPQWKCPLNSGNTSSISKYTYCEKEVASVTCIHAMPPPPPVDFRSSTHSNMNLDMTKTITDFMSIPVDPVASQCVSDINKELLLYQRLCVCLVLAFILGMNYSVIISWLNGMVSLPGYRQDISRRDDISNMELLKYSQVRRDSDDGVDSTGI